MKKEAYEVEYYEPKSVLAMQADRREEKHRRKQKKGIRAGRILLGVAILLFWEVSARLGWIDDYYWSSPSLIAQTAIVQWKEKILHMISTLPRCPRSAVFSGNIGRRSFRIVLLVVKDVCKDF